MNEILVRKVYEAIAEIYSRRENVKITVKDVRLKDECAERGRKVLADERSEHRAILQCVSTLRGES